jgi:hypothetical protein
MISKTAAKVQKKYESGKVFSSDFFELEKISLSLQPEKRIFLTILIIKQIKQ